MSEKVPIGDITFSWEIYPRTSQYWNISYKYGQAMRQGAIFPPILLTRLEGKVLLIDGWHRLEARKQLGQKEVDAEFIECADKDEALVQAVKANQTHGYPMMFSDFLRVAEQLRQNGHKVVEIAQLLKMDERELAKHLKARVVRDEKGKTVMDDKTNRPLIAKKMFLHSDTKPKSEQDQSLYMGESQLRMINEVISLIESGHLAADNQKVKQAIEKLARLLSTFVKPRKRA